MVFQDGRCGFEMIERTVSYSFIQCSFVSITSHQFWITPTTFIKKRQWKICDIGKNKNNNWYRNIRLFHDKFLLFAEIIDRKSPYESILKSNMTKKILKVCWGSHSLPLSIYWDVRKKMFLILLFLFLDLKDLKVACCHGQDIVAKLEKVSDLKCLIWIEF